MASDPEPGSGPSAPPGQGAEPERVSLPRIPGYRIEGLLGRGATGVVYRAVQLAVERPVAIKILHPELVGTRRAVRRLQREARTAARLAHPNIISAIDMGEQGGQWWYAMELVEGVPLSERMREGGPLSEREALRIFIPLADALEHFYEAGVVHRDIKPANVLIDEHGRVRLIDLGLAFAEDDPSLTRTGGTLGTPHFISPEQARDSSDTDTRSDIWSFGASLFQAVCGRPPFEGTSVAEILSSVLYDPVPDPRQLAPHVSKGLALVIRKCLVREPAGRYQTPRELFRDLERIRERRAPKVRVAALDPVATQGRGWLRQALTAALVLFAVTGLWLVITRPWTGVDQDPLAAYVAGEPWPLFAQVQDNFERRRIRHQEALAQLDGIQVPAPLLPQENVLRTTILADLDQSLALWRREVQDEVEALTEDHAWPDAARYLARDARRELLGRTGFGAPADLPGGRRVRAEELLASLATQVQEGREGAVVSAHSALEGWYRGERRPEVRRLADEHRWRDALALVDEPTGAWPAFAQADVRGMGSAELEAALAGAERVRAEDRRLLRREWAVMNGALRSWVERTQELLDENLEAGVERDVGAKLEEAWQAELERRSITLEQVPEEWDDSAFPYMMTAAGELRAREAQLIERDARRILAEEDRFAERLCSERRYADAARLWERRRADPRFASLAEEIDRRRRECEMLAGLMRRAADGVRARAGESFEVWFGSIAESGVIDPGVDPLTRGFELVTGLGTRRLWLVPPPGAGEEANLLRAHETLVLAGIAGSTDPEERLLRALFRYYEGQYDAAQQSLPIGSSRDDALVEDLAERIHAATEALSRRAASREEELEGLIRVIKWNANESGHVPRPKKILADIEAVRTRFEGLLSGVQRDDLRVIEERLLGSLERPTLEDVFGPFAPGDLDRGAQLFDVVLRFPFAGRDPGPWYRGAWTPTARGMELTRVLDPAQLLDPANALRLPLAPPLDSRSRYTVRIALESAGENELIVSAAGHHVAFLDGPALPRFAAQTGQAAQALSRARGARSQADSFRGFRRDAPSRLVLVLGQGSIEVEVDGRSLNTRKNFLVPEVESPELSIRALRPMRILEVVLEARRLPQ